MKAAVLRELPRGTFTGAGGVGQTLSPSAILVKLETIALEGPQSASSVCL